MTESARRRILAWEGCLNARDLGGYRTAGGGETLWGAIVRCDNPSTLTEAGRKALLDHGIRLIVDLRLPDEVTQYPNPFAGTDPQTVAYENISFIDPAASRDDPDLSLLDMYTTMIDLRRPAVVQTLRTIAGAPEGGVMIHCMGGKDRTGLISALLLELAGVPRHTIGEDYALTAECLRSLDEEFLERGPGTREARERELALFAPRPEIMEQVLEHIDRTYGGTEPYLLGGCLTPEEIDMLRSRMLPRD